MQVGQLFFSLGFKSTGTAAAENFETVTSQLADTSTKLIQIFEQMGDTLEKIALKMNATTKEELELFKANQKTEQSVVKLDESLAEQEEQQDKNTESAKKHISVLKNFVKSVDNTIGILNRQKGTLVGVAIAMVTLSKNASNYAMQLVRFNQLTGLNTQSLQRLQRQAAMSGLGAEEVSDALKELQETSVNIAMGRGGSDAWQLLGIRPGLDPFQQLNQLKKAMGNMSTPFFTKLAKEAGLSESFIGFLKDIKDLPPPDENLILSEDEIMGLRSFSISFNKAMDGWQILLKKVGALLTPITKNIMFIFDRWAWALTNLINLFNRLGETSKSVMKLIGLGLAVVAFKLMPLIAGITLLILLIDDFITFMQGGDSLIGRFFKAIPAIIDGIKAYIGSFIDWVTEKFEKFSAMKLLTDALKAINPYAGMFMNKPESENSESKFVPYGQNFAQGAQNTVNNNITISVPGVSDPEAFAKQVSDALKRQNTDGYFQNGNTGQ
jgi:dsDNA-binding SOS-regulon protein